MVPVVYSETVDDDFAALVGLLDLDQMDELVFRGGHPPGRENRAFGGQLIAQALVAAQHTIVDNRPPCSLHCYFVRPGLPGHPIDYRVERVKDGRSFSSRRVIAHSYGKEIFSLDASFQAPEHGLEFTPTYDMTGVAAPEDCITYLDWMLSVSTERDADWARSFRPIDNRYVNPPPDALGDPVREPQLFWLKAKGDLGDEPGIHQTVAAFASDESISDIVLLPHGRRWIEPGVDTASLDHTMWFHRPFRADEWLLFVQQTVATFGGRGLARGDIYTADGVLVSICVQDSMVRVES